MCVRVCGMGGCMCIPSPTHTHTHMYTYMCLYSAVTDGTTLSLVLNIWSEEKMEVSFCLCSPLFTSLIRPGGASTPTLEAGLWWGPAVCAPNMAPRFPGPLEVCVCYAYVFLLATYFYFCEDFHRYKGLLSSSILTLPIPTKFLTLTLIWTQSWSLKL